MPFKVNIPFLESLLRRFTGKEKPPCASTVNHTKSLSSACSGGCGHVGASEHTAYSDSASSEGQTRTASRSSTAPKERRSVGDVDSDADSVVSADEEIKPGPDGSFVGGRPRGPVKSPVVGRPQHPTIYGNPRPR